MKKMKTIADFLDNVDIIGSIVIVYMWEDFREDEEAEPIWEGMSLDTPYWVSKLKLDWIHECDECPQPIEFRTDLGEKHNHRPGFVITCTDELV